MDEPGLHVLLIEDKPDDVRLIEAALASTGEVHYQVEVMLYLSQAVEALAQESFDIILLDLDLPDANGHEVFKQVSLVAADALILILSTPAGEDGARLAVQNGADDYLVKSQINAMDLPRALRYLMERRAVREALTLSEARFHAMSDASPLGIFVSDAAGECVYTNEAYHKISGLTFEQTLGAKEKKRRQYWRRKAPYPWRIFYESDV